MTSQTSRLLSGMTSFDEYEATSTALLSSSSHQRNKVGFSRNERVVSRKDGHFNLKRKNYSRKLYLGDPFHTLINCSWARLLLLFFSIYVMMFSLFASIYYGLFEYHNKDCVANLNSFVDSFAFSVQTMMTIGYGGLVPDSSSCPLSVLFVTLQALIGLLLSSMFIGIVYAKFAMPGRRARTIIFSEKAVINTVNGKPCLQFRVANMRKHELIDARVQLFEFKREITREGQLMTWFRPLNLLTGWSSSKREVILTEQKLVGSFPWTVVHPIDEFSPLYDQSDMTIATSKVELIVVVEFIDSSTSNSIQAKYSYNPSDIVFDHRFVEVLEWIDAEDSYSVDFSRFHLIELDKSLQQDDSPYSSYDPVPAVRRYQPAPVERELQTLS
eukprot:TRINITY_DN2195_c0_g1_i1.p1 TRINITY_DN2195_c0_g1~~TRINITY_DN2195_c0_g1_i1.p1  ORF type:complete len:427 (+),score=81.70 TRINITY_DN2195_c0_g1_i1:129-1283(+)